MFQVSLLKTVLVICGGKSAGTPRLAGDSSFIQPRDQFAREAIAWTIAHVSRRSRNSSILCAPVHIIAHIDSLASVL